MTTNAEIQRSATRRPRGQGCFIEALTRLRNCGQQQVSAHRDRRNLRRRRPTWWHSVAGTRTPDEPASISWRTCPRPAWVADRGRSSLPFCLFTRVPYRGSGAVGRTLAHKQRAAPVGRSQVPPSASTPLIRRACRSVWFHPAFRPKFQIRPPAAGCRRSSTTFGRDRAHAPETNAPLFVRTFETQRHWLRSAFSGCTGKNSRGE